MKTLTIKQDDKTFYFKIINGLGVIGIKAIPEKAKNIDLTERDIHRFIDSINRIEACHLADGVTTNITKFEREWCSPKNWHKLLSCYIAHYGEWALDSGMSLSTRNFLYEGSSGGWNNGLFKAVKDLQQQGFSKAEIEELLKDSTNKEFKGRLDRSDKMTISSALKHEPRRPPRENNKSVANIAAKYKAMVKERLVAKLRARYAHLQLLSAEELEILRDRASTLNSKDTKLARYKIECGTDDEIDLILVSRKFNIKELLEYDLLDCVK